MRPTEELTTFFRANNGPTGLPKDFGAVYEGGKYIYNWHLPRLEEDNENRCVELRFYPDYNVIHVIARISPMSFRHRYRENQQTIGILKFQDIESAKPWIKKTLWVASQFARNSSLLEVEFKAAMPGTYRDTL